MALLCAAPFLQPYHRYPLTSFYSEWLAFALGLGVLAVLLARRTWDRAEVPWVAFSPFALAALLMVHGALGWSPYFGQALIGALYLIWAGALIVAARALVLACGADAVFAVIAAGLAAGALLSAGIGIIQHFNLITPLNAWVTRPTGSALFGNLAQPNHFAAHATLGLFSLVYLYSRSRIPLVVAAAGATPLLFVLGLSGSRSAWLYLYAAFALAALLRLAAPHGSAGRRLFVACGALIIVYQVLQLLVGAGWFKPADRETVTAVERLFSGAESISERFSLWRAAWTMALEHPLSGAGWGVFSENYFALFTAAAGDGAFGLYHNAHNIALHLLAETGVIGAGLALVPLLIWLRQNGIVPRAANGWLMLALLAVLVIHSLLEYPLWYAYFLGIAALLLGSAPTRAFVPKHARRGPLLAWALVLIGMFNLVTLWLDYRDFERVFRRAARNCATTISPP